MSATILVFCLISTATPGPAAAWEEPEHWADLGTVDEWAAQDVLFFRLYDDPRFLNRSGDAIDQHAAYEKSKVYEGKYDALSLDHFMQLDAGEQEKRIKASRKHLGRVENFRLRIANQAQQTREGRGSTWGTGVADMTVIGDRLRNLRTAVGLDPSNPYAWHLYAWFARIVGDLERTERALNGCEAALALVPDGELLPVRRGVALDRAWLARDSGDFVAAATHLAAARELEADPFQLVMLTGLIAAQTGDQETAIQMMKQVRSVNVRRFPVDYRTTGSDPAINNVRVWSEQPSDYAEKWIMALAWIEAGHLDMAGKAFGRYRFDDIYPLGWRFWRDAGYIYELTGRRKAALRAWDTARMWTPYAVYFPYKPYEMDLGRLTGRPGKQPIYMSFDQFYLAGNQLVLGVYLTEQMEKVTDETARQVAAMHALDVLEECGDAGVYPAQAALLRGAVYHRMNDLDMAALEVNTALDLLENQGDGPGYRAVLDELATVAADRTPSEIQAFFGQAGTARSRWEAPQDPEGQLADLRAAYAADQGAENRLALAQFLIRNDEAAEGRALVADRNTVQDLSLALEADRVLGESELAVALAGDLAGGQDRYNDAGLWTLVGFICLDAGEEAAGRRALERAMELDPGNHGLKLQLTLMGDVAGG